MVRQIFNQISATNCCIQSQHNAKLATADVDCGKSRTGNCERKVGDGLRVLVYKSRIGVHVGKAGYNQFQLLCKTRMGVSVHKVGNNQCRFSRNRRMGVHVRKVGYNQLDSYIKVKLACVNAK